MAKTAKTTSAWRVRHINILASVNVRGGPVGAGTFFFFLSSLVRGKLNVKSFNFDFLPFGPRISTFLLIILQNLQPSSFNFLRLYNLISNFTIFHTFSPFFPLFFCFCFLMYSPSIGLGGRGCSIIATITNFD